jgi:hypothetical protein
VQIAPETCRAKYRGIKNTYSVHLVGLSMEHIHSFISSARRSPSTATAKSVEALCYKPEGRRFNSSRLQLGRRGSEIIPHTHGGITDFHRNEDVGPQYPYP